MRCKATLKVRINSLNKKEKMTINQVFNIRKQRIFLLIVGIFILAYHFTTTFKHCCVEKESDCDIVVVNTERPKDHENHSQKKLTITANTAATEAVAESDLGQFKNPNISTIMKTPNFRWWDDHAVSAQNNIYLEKYKLHYCKIDKNMGSTMQAIICYIDDQRRYNKLFFDSAWQHGLDGTECGKSTANGPLRKRFLKAAEETDFFAEKNGMYHFSIIRHPIARFISAFIDICVNRARRPREARKLCFACRGNMECFVPKLHDFLYKQSQHRPVTRWPLDWHFLPQSWYCAFDEHIDKYDKILKYGRNEQFWQDLVVLLRGQGVEPNLLVDIETKLKTKTNLHATFKVSDDYEQKLRNNPVLLEYVYKIYYLDFVWFHYRLSNDAEL